MTYLPVAGTHGWRGEQKGEWWRDSSPFAVFMLAHNAYHLAAGRRPFVWSTDLNGHRFWRRLVGMKDWHSDWESAGHALYFYLRPFNDDDDTYVKVADRNLIVHSHGLQPVLYACAAGLRINSLVSVMSPVRGDMVGTTALARPNIGRWLHLHSDDSDRVQVAGEIGDGRFGKHRTHPDADRNDLVPKVGHSKILSDDEAMQLWESRGWLAWLREGAVA